MPYTFDENGDIVIKADNIQLTSNGFIANNPDFRDAIETVNDSKKTFHGEEMSTASDYDLIKEYIYLLEHVKDIRKDYELCLLRNQEEYKKYNQETDFQKFLCASAELDDESWLLETEMYSGIANELIRRGYLAYIDILWNRYIEE